MWRQDKVSLKETKIGILKETTWGTSLIDNNADTTYLLGITPETLELPYPEAKVANVGSAADSRLPQLPLVKQQFVFGTLRYALLDGWSTWLLMGGSSTAGSNPYTHTITAATPGNDLPSFTLHHELLGSGATDWLWQITGIRPVAWQLSCKYDVSNPLLWMESAFIGKSATTTAVKLDTDPVPRITGVKPFHWNHLSSGVITWKGAALNNLIGVRIKGSTNIFNVFSDYTTIPTMQIMPSFSPIYVELEFSPPEGDLFLDDLIAGTQTGDLVLKWLRSADDYIQFNGTNCTVLNHPVALSRQNAHSMIVTLQVLTPSFEIKDNLAGSVYGE